MVIHKPHVSHNLSGLGKPQAPLLHNDHRWASEQRNASPEQLRTLACFLCPEASCYTLKVGIGFAST